MRQLLKQGMTLGFLAGALLAVNLVWGFTEPSSPPPGSNTPAPLHVGAQGQSKSGGLILNTGGAQYGLIVDQGNVGIGIQTPTQKLDVAGYIRGATGLCIGSDCRTGWPSAGGGGTVTSLSAGSGISLSPNPITTSGTISAVPPRYCVRKINSQIIETGGLTRCPGNKVITGHSFSASGECPSDAYPCVECSDIEIYSC